MQFLFIIVSYERGGANPPKNRIPEPIRPELNSNQRIGGGIVKADLRQLSRQVGAREVLSVNLLV